MPTLSSAELGPFYVLVPILIAIYAVLAAAYFYKAHNNKTMAISFLVWFVVVVGVTYPDPFIKSLSFSQDSLLDNLAGVIWYNVAFATPATVLAIAWWRLQWFRDLFLAEVPAWLMIGFQSYRVAGFAYIYLWATDVVGNFAMASVGFSDAFISLTAWPLALYVRRYGLRETKRIVVGWTVIGLSDVSLGFLLFFLNYFKIYSPDISLAIFMLFPVSVIVLYNVEWVFFTHLLFLFKLEELCKAKINAPAIEATTNELLQNPVSDYQSTESH